MKATNAIWEKTILKIRRDLIRDYGFRAKITYRRDKNGDFGDIESVYGIMKADLVNRDLELTIDVTDDPPKGGVSISTFCGLREALKGENPDFSYAVFEDGRSFRLLNWRAPEVADPVKRAAEITLTHLERDGQTAPTNSGANKTAKRANTAWPKTAQETVAKLWIACRKADPDARERDCFSMHEKTDRMPSCILSFSDFKKCKDAAKKQGLIPLLHPKRGKSSGNVCQ